VPEGLPDFFQSIEGADNDEAGDQSGAFDDIVQDFFTTHGRSFRGMRGAWGHSYQRAVAAHLPTVPKASNQPSGDPRRRRSLMARNAAPLRLGRRHLVIGLAVAALGMAACQSNLTPAASPVAGAGIVVQPASVDLGQVPFNQLAHDRFTVTNAGASTVHFGTAVRVRTLEGC
jgi:hypothetical protein